VQKLIYTGSSNENKIESQCNWNRSGKGKFKIINTHTHMQHLNGHFPGKPGLAACPLDSVFVILILSILTGWTKTFK